LPQSLIKPEASFQNGQDSDCTLPGYDTVQRDTTFRKNILPPFSVFNTNVGLVFRLIVDQCINVYEDKCVEACAMDRCERKKSKGEEQHHQVVCHYNRPDFV